MKYCFEESRPEKRPLHCWVWGKCGAHCEGCRTDYLSHGLNSSPRHQCSGLTERERERHTFRGIDGRRVFVDLWRRSSLALFPTVSSSLSRRQRQRRPPQISLGPFCPLASLLSLSIQSASPFLLARKEAIDLRGQSNFYSIAFLRSCPHDIFGIGIAQSY